MPVDIVYFIKSVYIHKVYLIKMLVKKQYRWKVH